MPIHTIRLKNSPILLLCIQAGHVGTLLLSHFLPLLLLCGRARQHYLRGRAKTVDVGLAVEMETSERARQIQLISHLLHIIADHVHQLRMILVAAGQQPLHFLSRPVRLIV